MCTHVAVTLHSRPTLNARILPALIRRQIVLVLQFQRSASSATVNAICLLLPLTYFCYTNGERQNIHIGPDIAYSGVRYSPAGCGRLSTRSAAGILFWVLVTQQFLRLNQFWRLVIAASISPLVLYEWDIAPQVAIVVPLHVTQFALRPVVRDLEIMPA